MLTERPLQTYLPSLRGELKFAAVGRFPTEVHPLSQLVSDLPKRVSDLAYIKREDKSSPAYGGNKVRTLEVFFGEALRLGQEQVFASGAYGSNHAVATVIHARRLGLRAGAILFPQPPSEVALENFRVSHALAQPLLPIPHWSFLPFEFWRLRRRLGDSALIMAPGGATALGALGYVSAALELAEQVRSKRLPSPHRIVVGVGSTCTTAGLLVGLRLARRLGIAFSDVLPEVVAVRVTPWPVTSQLRIVYLAQQCAALLARLSGDPACIMPRSELQAGLVVEDRFLGRGYGYPTEAGISAIKRFAGSGCVLDTTYSAKAAAGLFQALEERAVPTLFWATKSSAPLPIIDDAGLSGKLASWASRAGAA